MQVTVLRTRHEIEAVHTQAVMRVAFFLTPTFSAPSPALPE